MYVDPTSLQAYTSCRLVLLDKCPGVCPVGIRGSSQNSWEGSHESSLQESIGSIQLCARQDAGCEAAVHAIKHLFSGEDKEALILVDTTNAI